MSILRPYVKSWEARDLAADHADSVKVDQYRIGAEAFYTPEFPVTKYIPFEKIESVQARGKSYSAHTCCGGGLLKLPVVVLSVEGKIETFQFGSEESAARAADILIGRMKAYRQEETA